MTGANPVRGEAEVTIGDVTIVLVANMEGIASLSAALGCATFNDFYSKCIGGEVATCLAAISQFTERGWRQGADGKENLKAREAAKAARQQFAMDDVTAMQHVFAKLFNALVREKPKADGEPYPGNG